MPDCLICQSGYQEHYDPTGEMREKCHPEITCPHGAFSAGKVIDDWEADHNTDDRR
jgi:hypothetical protein